ncbi:MAG: sugar phosphate isomerase/epimerase [Lentisphaerae bacterium]|jgi:sugar phosphate isomerase/epimerase|nr:sugar phosphate isomerase/epimerase [Lentisphaerota bacterium]
MSKIKLGLQLYSIRDEFAADPAGTLKAVAEMGYDGVEFAGPPKLSGAELRELLDKNGLECCGWHTSYDSVQDDNLAATIALNKEVNNRFLIVPGLPGEITKTRADWLKIASFFTDLAEKLSSEGMKTGYHNHSSEFQFVEGEMPWITLFDNTSKDVIAQLDTGNALCGGADCVELLNRYPNQGTTVHLKPFTVDPSGETKPANGFRPLIGDDSLPWGEILSICKNTAGTEWCIVEYESDAFTPMKAVDLSLQRLKKLGF